MDLTGKIAIVTGGASGMGAATSGLFAELGATVIVVDLDADGAHAVAHDTGGAAMVGDVSSPAFCDDVVESTRAQFGAVDILVNAAGVITRDPAVRTSDADWRRVLGVNVDGVFYMSRAAARVMLDQGRGAIVNFGSVWGDVGNPGHAAYAASKGAVHQLARSMALEHARDGIRVNAVAPGEIDTPMLASERAAPFTDEDRRRLADDAVPMGRLGDPSEVARVVAFLASDEASYMTGSIVAVDAGYIAR